MGEICRNDPDAEPLYRRVTRYVRELRAWADLNVDDLVSGAVSVIPGAQYAGITVIRKRRDVQTVASTHRYPIILDELQGRHLEGPCLSAQWEHHTMQIRDMASETRWPKYCQAALQATPVRSIMAFELFAGGEMLGALNVYADQANSFDDKSAELGLMFATHAALVWYGMNKENQFASALASRDIIGQAKGVIMERYKIDAIQAFEILKRLSQDSNTPLAQLAQRLIAVDFGSGK